MRVLVAEAVDKAGLDVLRSAAEDVVVRKKMTNEQLLAVVAEFDALLVRSATMVTADIIERGARGRLRIIARAGVGVDNVDVDAATRYGIVVVNSPTGNTIAAAEHTLAMLLSLARNIPAANSLATQPGSTAWSARGKFVGVQLFGKTLGIVGMGRVGQHVARCAHGLGMQVIAHDPFLSSDRVVAAGADACLALDELLRRVDFLTLHVPLTNATRGLISTDKLALLRPHARIVNASRGGVIDETALVAALLNGKLAGAAIDVLSQEPPPKDSPIIAAAARLGSKLILTPHLGASTAEAQLGVAVDVARQVVTFLNDGQLPSGAVNIPPELRAPGAAIAAAPWMRLADALSQLVGQMFVDRRIVRMVVRIDGDAPIPTNVAIAAACSGLLSHSAESGRISFVNSIATAEHRGIIVASSKSTSTVPAMFIEVAAENGEIHNAIGTCDSAGRMWLNSIDGFRLLLPVTSRMLVVHHIDKPGVIGNVGKCLGTARVNVDCMAVGRGEREGGAAVMVLTVDDPLDTVALNEIAKQQHVKTARFVELVTSSNVPKQRLPKL